MIGITGNEGFATMSLTATYPPRFLVDGTSRRGGGLTNKHFPDPLRLRPRWRRRVPLVNVARGGVESSLSHVGWRIGLQTLDCARGMDVKDH
jgi:hypothetical protein